MATYLENLKTARDNFASELATESASPKPSYSIDGQSVSWVEYYRFLREQITALDMAIAKGEPYQIDVQGWSR